MTQKTALMALRAVRFGLGALGWFAPKKTTGLMLLPVTGEASDSYLMRLFAVRDALMGIDITFAEDERSLRRNLALGIAVDLVDVTAGLIDGVAGRADPFSAAYRGAAALIGASLGAAALGRGPLAGNSF